jgi:hypothetical protein
MFFKTLNAFKSNKLLFIILFSIFSLGVYFCFINKYGWDWDTYAMIETYLTILENGYYNRSRGAGYMIPEIGIGFLSYYFGSFIVNLINFLLLIIGLILFYISFSKIFKNQLSFEYKNIDMLIIFIIISLTNHIVFKDSTIPMDYSWSFFFYSVGIYFVTKKKFELSIIFFSFCFCSRFNFIVFIIPTILLLNKSFLDYQKKLLMIFIVSTYGGLFYLPSWLQSSFSLDFIFSPQWYNNFKSAPILSLQELARFIHKTLSSLGLFFFISIFFLLVNKVDNFVIKLKKYKVQVVLIIVNLIVFFFFPWEPSFLWILIFSLNFILVTLFNKKILFFLVFLNLFNWLYEAKLIKVYYANDKCLKQAVDAKIKFNFEKGILLKISDRKQDTKCYPDILGSDSRMKKYRSQLINGERLVNQNFKF